MKKNSIIIVFLCFTTLIFSQQKAPKELEREARKDIREGNKLYNQLKFEDAEVAYKKAIANNPKYPKASYNLGNTMYQQNRFKEAVSQYEFVEKIVEGKPSKAETYHNMGNSFMKEKQYDKAVEAYKNSMRNNSKDDETRYNLALAQELLKNQQDKDNKEDKKDNKDDKNKDQKDKKEGDDEKKDDKNEDKDKGKDKEDPKSDEKKNEDKNKENQPPRQNQLSPEQMKQLLDAMNNEENKTQQKLNAQKAKGKKIKQEKDW